MYGSRVHFTNYTIVYTILTAALLTEEIKKKKNPPVTKVLKRPKPLPADGLGTPLLVADDDSDETVVVPRSIIGRKTYTSATAWRKIEIARLNMPEYRPSIVFRRRRIFRLFDKTRVFLFATTR